MKPLFLSRRTLLRGAGGIAVGLPALEIMGNARAATGVRAKPPKRFVISFGGISTGQGHNGDLVVPDKIGAGYDVKRGLKPLTDMGLRDDVSVVSGLVLPWEQGGVMPPGGRSVNFHFNTIGPQLSGTRGGPKFSGAPKGPTADQIVADAIAGTTPQRLLAYRIQPFSYAGSSTTAGDSGRQSWRLEKGKLGPVEPTVHPRLAFESLFSGFAATDNGEAGAKIRRLLHQRKSVLDLIVGDLSLLTPKLGVVDRARAQKHLDEVRSLERRLAAAPATLGGICKIPSIPSQELALGTGFSLTKGGDGLAYNASAGYSDEEQRGDLLSDYVAMAFACDLTRVSSYMITLWKCWMNMYPVSGWKSDMHEISHGAGPAEAMADNVGFIVKQFAKLARKLRDLPEIDGRTVLDHTAMVLLLEGGHGYDPETGKKKSTHSTENMIALVAGGAACGLRAGHHVSAPGSHPAKVVISAMMAAGGPAKLGEISGPLAGLMA